MVIVDGLMNLDDFAEETGIELADGPYETVAGFVVARLGELPAIGSAVVESGHRFEVSELDGRRIARIKVTAAPEAGAAALDAPLPE